LWDEEIENLAGLEGSLATQDGGVAEMGAKERSSHAEANHVDLSAVGLRALLLMSGCNRSRLFE
jgi:hypothetical protein